MQPIQMDCLDCNGAGCEQCDGKGYLDVTMCPQQYVTRDVWQVIEYAALYEKGLPPIMGGVLDQAQIFLAACQFIWAEERYWKSKLGILN